MTEEQFQHYASLGFNRVPLIAQARADLETPLSVYLKLARRSDTFLLESVVRGERGTQQFARYSYVGLAASTRLRAVGRHLVVERGGQVVETAEGDPLSFVRDYLKRFRVPERPELPRFKGGLVGYFGYDAVRWIEPRLAPGWLKKSGLDCPDLLLLLCEEVAVFDNFSGKLFLVVYADPARPGAYRDASHRLRELLALLSVPLSLPAEAPACSGEIRSNMAEGVFERAVARARDYIAAGDAMQVVLSRRLSRRYSGSPVGLYRALRGINPSPYMFYFDFGGFQVVGASPEILVRLESDAVTVRPLAGTRPRGRGTEEDRRLETELLADEKERAEHLMLVDLGRNDVGRVAAAGSVKVTDLMGIERYSHVMHIVSNVTGVLEAGCDWLDVFRASFPAGTVSGAPKIRAMEIIDELEPDRRGIYAGALGYIGFDGTMDLAIGIRTAVVKEGEVHVQAGAGVVADSVPEKEFAETEAKAGALMHALESAP
jgi:anthranilate synthase component I